MSARAQSAGSIAVGVQGKDADDHRIGCTEDIRIQRETRPAPQLPSRRDGGPASQDLRHRPDPQCRVAQAAVAGAGGVDGRERGRDRQALAEDLDRNPFEAFIADVATTAGEAKYAAKQVRKWMRRKYLLLELPQLPGRGWVEYEPYGTVLIIGAWNYPFYLTLGPAVGAIAAGNAVVLKPSEIAAASSRLMAELVPRYLDRDAIALIEGDGVVSQELIAQGLDRVMFTGGTEIGRKVYEGAAPHLTPVTLELGGKSPVIVAADADIDVAAKRIAWMKLLNAGQTCVAPDYVLADAKIRDELVEQDRRGHHQVPVGGSPSGMRIVNQRQFDRLSGYSLRRGRKGRRRRQVRRVEPAHPAHRGRRPRPGRSADAERDLRADPAGDHRPIPGRGNTFRQRAAQAAVGVPVHQVACTRERVIKEVPAGGMLVNHLAFQVSTAKLPFGGVGASGMGAYHGKWGFDEFSHRKSVLTKPTRPDLSSLIYPPYTARAFKMARRMF